MNKVNTETWLAWGGFTRTQDYPVSRIAELLPWAYGDMINAEQPNAEVENTA